MGDLSARAFTEKMWRGCAAWFCWSSIENEGR